MSNVARDTDKKGLKVSFEFFPPKTPQMNENLWAAIKRLEPLDPAFVSVTYGAGGSTRDRTHETVRRIVEETSVEPAAHLTCVGATREEVNEVADAYWNAGVRHIVALRGDPPPGQESYVPHPGGYERAVDLVQGLKSLHDFEISVAAYPEIHPEAESTEADLDNLKRKIDAGASHAITQFFFNNNAFLHFRDRAAAAGIDLPITPGIMPVTNFSRVAEMAKACGISVPDSFAHLFDGLDEEPDIRKLVAATFAAEQCERLEREGVFKFHFYTLNRAPLTYAICHILGLRAPQAPPD